MAGYFSILLNGCKAAESMPAEARYKRGLWNKFFLDKLFAVFWLSGAITFDVISFLPSKLKKT
jgi:hypothetical protein